MKFPYEFNNTELREQALIHRSLSGHHNERLEFLGDSILGAVIAHSLFDKFRNIPEGDLTRMRAYLVNGQALSELADTIEIGDDIKLGTGEKKSGGVKRSTKADALEALIGAVYLDGGFDSAQKLILTIFADKLNQLDPKSIKKDAKTRLQEYCQKHKKELPEYILLEETGPMHDQTFLVQVHAMGKTAQAAGRSRKISEQTAAQLILDQL